MFQTPVYRVKTGFWPIVIVSGHNFDPSNSQLQWKYDPWSVLVYRAPPPVGIEVRSLGPPCGKILTFFTLLFVDLEFFWSFNEIKIRFGIYSLRR